MSSEYDHSPVPDRICDHEFSIDEYGGFHCFLVYWGGCPTDLYIGIDDVLSIESVRAECSYRKYKKDDTALHIQF